MKKCHQQNEFQPKPLHLLQIHQVDTRQKYFLGCSVPLKPQKRLALGQQKHCAAPCSRAGSKARSNCRQHGVDMRGSRDVWVHLLWERAVNRKETLLYNERNAETLSV